MLGWPRPGARRAIAGDARARRAHRLREPLSVAALRRHAAARLDRARALVLAGAAADGRAVRRARRDDPRAPEHGAARHLAETGSTIVFVTHSIAEAVFLSTRVVVMSARPGRITEMIEIDLPQPRTAETREEPRFFELVTARARGARPRRGGADRGRARAARAGRGRRARAAGARRDWLPAARRLRDRHRASGSGSSRRSRASSCCRGRRRSRARSGTTGTCSGSAGWYTFKEALGGFVVGSGAAIVVALVFARLRRVGDGADAVRDRRSAPVPIIAFAPITNAWFGVLNPHSKMAIAAILCFFPVLVNTLRGLHVGPARVDRADALLRGERASRSSAASAIPTALPFIFAGLKVATVLAMIGADRRRLLRRLDARARRADRELDLAVRLPVRLGGDRRRERLRDRLLRGGRARRAARVRGRPST